MIISVIVLFLMMVFYSCYFTKMISQSRQGIKTDQLGKGKNGYEKYLEITLKITTYILPVIQILSIVFYKNNLPITLRFVGMVVLFLGVVVFVLSVHQMKDNWRAGVSKLDKTSLVTSGIYSVSRNPAFLGFDLMYIGILLAFYNFDLLLITIICIILFHLQIVKVEEEYLKKTFGDEYRRYCKKVNRYLG